MPDNAPHNALRHHVSGAIARGEKEAITARGTASAANFPKQAEFADYSAFADAVKIWEETHEHLSSDGYPVVTGAKFWDNNLRVVEIAPRFMTHSNTYADTGEIQTWHSQTTGSSSDTMTGTMREYGRLTRYYPHAGIDRKDATRYPVGTNYSDVK